MELPIGNPIGTDMNLGKADFTKLVPKFEGLKLNGYLVMDLLTNNGVEEGLLLFNNGKITGCSYNYLNKNKIINGDKALELTMKACAGRGVFDLYELDSKSIELAKTFNKDILISKDTDNAKALNLIPKVFEETYLEKEKAPKKLPAEEAPKEGPVNKEDVFKKYGIKRPDEKNLNSILEGVKVKKGVNTAWK